MLSAASDGKTDWTDVAMQKSEKNVNLILTFLASQKLLLDT